jgi:hypothetical protein
LIGGCRNGLVHIRSLKDEVSKCAAAAAWRAPSPPVLSQQNS